MFIVVEHDHTTNSACRNHMTRVETRGADVCARSVSDCISRIFEENETWESFSDGGPIGHISYEIWEKNALCIGGDNFLEVINTRYVGIETDITEDGLETKLHEWGDSRGEATRRGDNFGSFGEIESTETKKNGATTRVHK